MTQQLQIHLAKSGICDACVYLYVHTYIDT